MGHMEHTVVVSSISIRDWWGAAYPTLTSLSPATTGDRTQVLYLTVA
jgi:hypothetical protein